MTKYKATRKTGIIIAALAVLLLVVGAVIFIVPHHDVAYNTDLSDADSGASVFYVPHDLFEVDYGPFVGPIKGKDALVPPEASPADEEPNAEPAPSDPPEPRAEYTDDILVLVNRAHPVTESYVPRDLVKLDYRASDRSAEWQVMVREAAEAFNTLCGDAAENGFEIVVTTAYRSYAFQEYLYNNYVSKYGQEKADTFSAQPGKSEHQSGLAADVSSPSVSYQLTGEYGKTDEGIWLAENCWKYGFIIRFPEGKEDITGYMYEPWHIRYVGKDAAKEIYDANITLEEYLGEI